MPRGHRAWSRGSARTASGADVAISTAKLARGGAQLVGGREAIGETDRERGLALHRATRVHQLERALLADDRRQRHRDPESLVEAEAGEVAREAGLGRRHPEVGRERETEAAADRRALHRGDGRHRGAGDPCGLRVEVARVIDHVGAAEVGARAEVLALGAEHDHPAVGMVAEVLERVGERGEHVEVEVVVRRPVHLDRRHVIDEVDGHGLGGGGGRHRQESSPCREGVSAWPPAGSRLTKP